MLQLHILTRLKIVQETVWNTEVFNEHVSSFIDNMGLGELFPADHPRLRELLDTAAALTGDETNELNTGEDIANLTSLALFDKILYLGMLLQQYPLREIIHCQVKMGDRDGQIMFDYANNLIFPLN